MFVFLRNINAHLCSETQRDDDTYREKSPHVLRNTGVLRRVQAQCA